MEVRSLFLAALAVSVLAVVTISLVAFSLASVVVVAISGFALGCRLLYGGIVVIDDDHGVAALPLLVLGMTWVSGARVMRIVRVLGPAFFVARVLASFADTFAVFNDDDLTGVGVLLARGSAGSHCGDRQHKQE